MTISLLQIKNKFNIVQEDDINKPSLTEASLRARKKEEKLCKNCGRPLSSDKYEICQICTHEKQKRCEWPTREVLKEKIEELYNKVSGKGSVKVKQNLLKKTNLFTR